MNKEKVSIIATLANIFLGGGKLLVGFLINSSALIAEGIHSGLDVVSSFITFLGIKVSKKPVDKNHPYGYYTAESLGGLAVALLLAVSGIWIIYEGATHILKKETVQFTLWGILIIVISIILNEIMARLKFKYGRKEESLALIADAEHSRADVIASGGVLIGFIFIRYFPIVDGILAILIGLYILKESFGISKMVTDNLLGVRDEKIEEEIRKISKEKNILISDLKTRKIGAVVFAELKIKLDSQLRVEEAQKISEELQNNLLKKIDSLKYIVVQIETHKIKEGIVRPSWRGWGGRFGGGWGRRFRFGRALEGTGLAKMGLAKKGYRIIIPIKENEIFEDFGAPEYLIIDKENGEIVQKEKIRNPYFTQEGKFGRFGMRIIKFTDPDEIKTKLIGPGAREKARELGIRVTIIASDKKLEDIL